MQDLLWHAYEYLQQGGWVMIPLSAASLVMWALILDRSLSYRDLAHADVQPDQALAALSGKVPDETLQGEGLRRQLLVSLLAERTGDGELDRNILRQHALALRPRLRQHLPVIALLASLAPLLGLLGTVLGMIDTFQVISMHGTGNTRGMAGGISVALITTQAGLMVAVPGLLITTALSRRAQRLELRFDEFTHLLDRALRHQIPADPAQRRDRSRP